MIGTFSKNYNIGPSITGKVDVVANTPCRKTYCYSILIEEVGHRPIRISYDLLQKLFLMDLLFSEVRPLLDGYVDALKHGHGNQYIKGNIRSGVLNVSRSIIQILFLWPRQGWNLRRCYLPLHLHHPSSFIMVASCVARILGTDIGKPWWIWRCSSSWEHAQALGFIVGVNWDLLPVSSVML